jgi:hypothetical protein
LEKLVGLDEELVNLIIEKRSEGPLSIDTIKYGFPNMLALEEEDLQTDRFYSRQVVLFNEAVIIQKLTCNILIGIDEILKKVPKRDRKSRTFNGIEYDLYRLRLLSDFVNNEVIQKQIEDHTKLHHEFSSMSNRDIIMKCINELEKEGYIERESHENVETIREDFIYFIDKRKELHEYVYREIREAGSSGLKFPIL